MSDAGGIYALVKNHLGAKSDAVDTAGTINAKLAALQSLVYGTSKVQIIYPDPPAAFVAVTNGNNAYGSWAQIKAATGAAGVLNAISAIHTTANQNLRGQIGVGAAASEAAIWDWLENNSQQGQTGDKGPGIVVPIRVANGARLAARAAENGANQSWWAVGYIPTPLT